MYNNILKRVEECIDGCEQIIVTTCINDFRFYSVVEPNCIDNYNDCFVVNSVDGGVLQIPANTTIVYDEFLDTYNFYVGNLEVSVQIV